VRFLSRPYHYRINVFSPANFLGVCQRRIHGFVDLGKVYDRVLREKFWGGLWEHSVDGCLLLAAKSPYSRSEDCARVDGVNSQPFTVGVGLRQWCAQSPLLFIVCIRVLHTTTGGPNPTYEAISPGCKTHFANSEKIIYL